MVASNFAEAVDRLRSLQVVEWGLVWGLVWGAAALTTLLWKLVRWISEEKTPLTQFVSPVPSPVEEKPAEPQEDPFDRHKREVTLIDSLPISDDRKNVLKEEADSRLCFGIAEKLRWQTRS